MNLPSSMGLNRTGIDMSPQNVEDLMKGVLEFPPTSSGNVQTLTDYRRSYIIDADPIGTVPMPGTVKGVVKTSVQKLLGRHAEELIDKLGGRLAFERTGTRLYDALLGKALVRTDEADSLPIEQLQLFRAEEAAHMGIVWDALRQLGADPTCVTPMADTNAVASIGLMQIMTDPRMSIAQSLHAIHMAELADNDGWQLLITLAKEMGQDEMASSFTQALAEEDRHLSEIRRLVERMCLNEASA
jgi:rubrerythrin